MRNIRKVVVSAIAFAAVMTPGINRTVDAEQIGFCGTMLEGDIIGGGFYHGGVPQNYQAGYSTDDHIDNLHPELVPDHWELHGHQVNCGNNV